jgi:carotenoid cleavage dioxygenase-like enzyme
VPKVITSFPITLRNTSYNHDFAATERFSVVFDGNLVLNWDELLQSIATDVNAQESPQGNVSAEAAAAGPVPETKGAISMWQFLRNIPGRIGVFPRHATSQAQVVWFDVAPFCLSHTVNAYEDPLDGDVVVIVSNNIGHEGFSPTFPLDQAPQDPDANLHRWRLNVATGEVLEDAALRFCRSDFPVFNSTGGHRATGLTGKPFRYVYASLLGYQEPNHAPYLYGCYKFDLARGTFRTQLWGAEKGRYCAGEPFFVPRQQQAVASVSGATGSEHQQAEDDGYLVVLVNDMAKQRTELRIYDAGSDFGVDGEGSGDTNSIPAPLATVICPRRVVPLGTHGVFLTNEIVSHVHSNASFQRN